MSENKSKLDELIEYLTTPAVDDDGRAQVALEDVEIILIALRYARALSDKSIPFICGASTDAGRDGLPSQIVVCPAHGADVTGVYRRIDSALKDQPHE
jgi:hypothetical protein